MTLRSLARQGGGGQRQIKQKYMKDLFEFIEFEGSGFLGAQNMRKGCNHEWKILDSGYACCILCGEDHDCSSGECSNVSVTDYHERVCLVTGCVIGEGEFREERSAFERSGFCEKKFFIEQELKKPKLIPILKGIKCDFGKNDDVRKNRFLILSVFDNNATKFHETVEDIVRDILFSNKTKICFVQEIKRNEGKMVSLFSKLIRECSHNKECSRPNMCLLLGQVFFAFRRNRLFYSLHDDKRCSVIEGLIKDCTCSIANLIMNHGGQRVAKQLQNHYRCREFICSMLYLMRMGITYQKRQLLPKVELLNEYLPMQVLLPLVFKIRAKSITEGENIIKLDIRKLPF
jgi:hypothetical protein